MSAEGQTIREALDTLLLLLVDEHRTSDEHEVEIREEYAPAFEALAALEARLAEAERALREIANPLPCQCMTDPEDVGLECYCLTMPSPQDIARAALPSESETLTTKGTQ